MADCGTCRGKGRCPKCNGRGLVGGMLPVNCPNCRGDGKCFVCNGTGNRR